MENCHWIKKYSKWEHDTHSLHGEIFSESWYSKTNLDCNYSIPIDLEPNGIPFGTKTIGKV